MQVSELIEIYTAAINDAAEQGADSVPLFELQRVHAEIRRIAAESPDNVEVGEAALEHYKAQLAANAEHSRSVHELNLEMLRATVMTGQSALKSSLLINGGAAVALLAFLGNAWAADVPRRVMLQAAYGLSLFVWGVLAAAAAAGATYLSQAGFGNELGKFSHRIGKWARWLAIALVVTAYVLFGFGAWHACTSLSA